MIDEDTIAFLLADTAIAAIVDDRVSVGDVPSDDDGNPLVDAYIWLSLFDELPYIDLDGESGLSKFNIDIECCSTSVATAKQLGRLVQKRLQGHCGTFGSSDVQAVYVESKDDNYEKRNQFGESDMTVIALDVDIFADDAVEDS